MGRYVNFSTGAEYKFAFAIQDSEDILEFGGYLSVKDSNQIVWIAEKDLAIVRNRLKDGNSPMLDLEKYEKTLNGYNAYMNDIRVALRKSMDIKDSYETDIERQCEMEPYYLLVLGHSIYFQLHMEAVLYADYES